MKAFHFFNYFWPKKINLRYALNLRANIASLSFISCSIPMFIAGQFITGIALSLGSIACGISDTASVAKHRRIDFIVSLLLFFTNALCVNYLFEHSILFALYIASSSFLLFMLAIYSPRLGNIGFATILSGIYAMLLHSPSLSVWHIPTALVLGAIWYGMWQWLIGKWLPHQEDKDLLYEIYQLLGQKLLLHTEPLIRDAKASGDNFIRVAKMRSAFMVKYNELQNRVHQQLSAGEHSPQLATILPAMQAASIIAEQTRLMHFVPTADFRIHNTQLLEAINSGACALAKSIKQLKHGLPRSLPDIDFAQLRRQVQQQVVESKKDSRQINLLESFIDKLAVIHMALASLKDKKYSSITDSHHQALNSEKPRLKFTNNLSLQWQKFISQFTFESNYFRHALRGTLCLTLGFILVRLLDLEFGFWTLMTSLLVLKPNLSMTWSRFLHRVCGTLAGLAVVGLMLHWQVPQYILPLVFCIGATLFFHTTARQYGFSVFCVTLFVFSGFALNGQGNAIVLPRLENTFLGVLLPVLFVLLIAPGWQKEAFPQQLLNTVRGYLSYLSHLKQTLLQAKDAGVDWQQSLQPYFQRCVRDDTNLFDHWLGYLGEPKQQSQVSAAILLCCQSSNVMLRVLTQLNTQAHEFKLDELTLELDNTINIFAQLNERLVHFSQSPHFFDFLSEHKQEFSPKIDDLGQQSNQRNPQVLLSLLQQEVNILLH